MMQGIEMASGRRGAGLQYVWISGGMFLLLGILFYRAAPYPLNAGQWLSAMFSPDVTDYRQIIVHFTFLPRLVMALLCGAGLAVAGCLMQYVLRNPLASPTTLGVAAGAELGLAASLLFVPASLGIGHYWFAFLGGVAATLLVFLLTAKRGFAPLQMVLAGMVVSLFFGSLNMMLLLIHEQQLTSVFIWGAGALNQNDWQGVTALLPLLLFPAGILVLLLRPLSVLQLGEEVASSVGVKVAHLRVVSLGLGIFITAGIVSQVGIIGFVGLVAPALAKLLGARHLWSRLLLSSGVGALLLLIADLVIQPLSGVGGELLPTGAVTALIGAPFLLWLLHRQAFVSSLKAEEEPIRHYHPRSFRMLLTVLSVMTIGVLLLATVAGNSQAGWQWTVSETLFDLRLPRVLVALLAGMGLALAGTVIQRVTGNAMASPEVMGISAGAALALVLGAMAGWTVQRIEQMALGTAGALVVMGLIWFSGRRHRFAPTQMLLTGIGISAALDAMIRIAMSSGQENLKALLTWLSGSTYLVAGQDVILMLAGVVVIGGALLLLQRWLDVISLGEVIAGSIGLSCQRVRQALMLLAAMLTALATIVVGPLSFVGLLAPHMARSLGQYSARQQLVVACLLGGNIMMLADWVGRNVWFPWQFPAGLLASVIGGGYFLYLLRK
ncbi:Fe(3+)-hydroxamate ABC transporter permease FhuB [Photobacterium atrarenae]|uniref:Fe(3+)-hydroxamate ABC transporter permease FhuB n=2 Tax=Photobacterium atrarenae TaxID=865757 RepID=A0ABY5GNG9_9GAMM|nr:Fe(3+)-hydroxamate ABC transporter permease FhuB [Photobacterium atrarenae]UTV30630.1 Fe(3+)-hydroxamate ABC transporter permease FhuB [Photobacterium atrarenae]